MIQMHMNFARSCGRASTQSSIPSISEFKDQVSVNGQDDSKEKSTYTSTQGGSKIMNRFLSNPSGLIASDASHKDFSLSNSISELSKGFYLGFHSAFHSQKETFLILRGEDLFMDGQRIPIKQMKGILLGASSSNFLRQKAMTKTSFTNKECFSLVTNLTSFDFSTDSSTKRYHFLIAMSWLIHTKSKSTGIVPLSKSDITLYTIRSKIKAMAAEANVRPNELFILGILKHMNHINDEDNFLKVKELFLKRFNLSRRLFNLCSSQFKGNAKDKKANEGKRIAMLNLKRINRIKVQRKQTVIIQKPKEELTAKETRILSYLVPGVKSIFQPKRIDHPVVLDLRRKLTNSSISDIY